MIEGDRPLLQVDNLVTGYRGKQVLDGVSIIVAPGEIVALIGHNGAGKSTLLKAVYGLLPIWEGRVLLLGARLDSVSPRLLRSAGVTYVPQGNRVFTELTVHENLEIGMMTLPPDARSTDGVDRVLTIFPTLARRLGERAGVLSGGEKQMLALANALISSPRLLLLDEPSLGLAAPIVTEALQRIRRISEESGAAVLIVEQKVRSVIAIAQRVYVLRNGKVSFTGPADSLQDGTKLREVYI